MSESLQPLSERIYRIIHLAQFAGLPGPGPRHTGYWWEARLCIVGLSPDDPGAIRDLEIPQGHPHERALVEACHSRRMLREIGSPADLAWHLEVLP